MTICWDLKLRVEFNKGDNFKVYISFVLKRFLSIQENFSGFVNYRRLTNLIKWGFMFLLF